VLTAADNRFLAAFENGSLPPESFDHEGHVRAAWCCLDAYGHRDGRERFVTALRRFVRIHGAEAKYHDTVTRAFLDLIAIHAPECEDWATFRRRHGQVVDDGMGLLLRHYSHEVLFSEAARAGYLAPDVEPFPMARPSPREGRR
jgi:hypothetical protein